MHYWSFISFKVYWWNIWWFSWTSSSSGNYDYGYKFEVSFIYLLCLLWQGKNVYLSFLFAWNFLSSKQSAEVMYFSVILTYFPFGHFCIAVVSFEYFGRMNGYLFWCVFELALKPKLHYITLSRYSFFFSWLLHPRLVLVVGALRLIMNWGGQRISTNMTSVFLLTQTKRIRPVMHYKFVTY